MSKNRKMSPTRKIVNYHFCTHLSNRTSDKCRPFNQYQTLLVLRYKLYTNGAERKSEFLKGRFTKFVHWYIVQANPTQNMELSTVILVKGLSTFVNSYCCPEWLTNFSKWKSITFYHFFTTFLSHHCF